jgi:uncharacterized protein (DUF885 family)
MSSEFEQIRDEYYQAWFRFHPETAVEVGIPGYAHLLAPYSDDDFGALLTLNEKLLSTLEELNSNDLSPAQQVDLKLMQGAAFLEMEALINFDWRKRDPQRFLPLEALYQLTVREVDDLPRALAQRLQAIPAYLRNAAQYLLQEPDGIPALWLQLAVTSCETGVEFIHALPQHPRIHAIAPQVRELNNWIHEAMEAVGAFGRFLSDDIGARAQGDFACGEQRFNHLLRHRHFLNISPQQLKRFGEHLFAETEQALTETCRKLTGNDDVAALNRKLQADHPSADTLLAEYEQQMQAARKFVRKHKLLTWPQEERLQVVATPEFLRHQIPFAAYMEPAVSDPKQLGYYYVTPADTEELLAEHNRAGLMHTCVHEAYPGHHMQFVTANLSPDASTLPRLVNPSATLYEGWALYCEQLMHEQGFLKKPEQNFILLKDRLWRALRVIIDVEIQTESVSVEQAADHMQQKLGFPRQQAMADLAWYSQAPTTPMGYATGWALINAARAHLTAQDTPLPLREFHDRLLAPGSMALPLVLQQAFGDDVAQQAIAAVFE